MTDGGTVPLAGVRVLSVGSYAPYRGIGHAGGEYVESHVQALEDLGAEVTMVAPARVHNVEAVLHHSRDREVHLVRDPRTSSGSLRKLFWKLRAYFAGSSFGIYFEDEFHEDSEFARLVRWADIVELQFEEFGRIASLVRRVNPSASISLVLHDVVSQRKRRALRSRGFSAAKLLDAVRIVFLNVAEYRILRAVDLILVLNGKDRDLVRRIHSRAAVAVLHPPLAGSEDHDARRRSRSDGGVVFVGAMNRAENVEAAYWFLDHVWDIVLRRRPDCMFTIAGSNPPEALKERACESKNVRVAGFVEDLGQLYAESSVAVVPLRNGAGVKFKTIEAMLCGIPLVTSTVGAEGIDYGRIDEFVADEPVEFAERVLRALDGIDAVVEDARAWASSMYSAQSHREALLKYYRALNEKRLDLIDGDVR